MKPASPRRRGLAPARIARIPRVVRVAHRPTVAALAGVAIVCSLTACDQLFHHTDHYTIRVDSIVAPYAVAATDTLRVRFHGWVGRNGCWRVESVEKQLRADALEVLFRGEHDEPQGSICIDMPVYLDHAEAVPPPIRTPFTITAHEPDGSTLQRVVVAPTTPSAPARDASAALQTDSLLYSLRDDLTYLRTSVGFSFRNPLTDTIYVANCNGQLVAGLEVQTGSGWLTFSWSVPIEDCLDAPIAIAPGATFAGRIAVSGGRFGSGHVPVFPVPSVDGVYRLVWQRLVLHYPGAPGDTVPAALRRSNAFALDDPNT